MLMKLAPESVRLRRMAKAFAAGELSEAEYRTARREAIDNFPVGAPLDDDTRPRSGEEPTLPNPRAAADAAEAPAAAVTGPARPRRWPWLAALALLLTAALLALPEARAAAADRQEVPPVHARSPDPASSPRLEVRQVVVERGGAAGADLPDDLLDRLQRHAQQALTELRSRSAPGPHGFTPAELNEVARLLNVLGVHEGAGVLDAADARDLSALIREQKRRRGVSVAELEQVAAAVQARLREEGYFLAVAYVPAQRIGAGVARVDVLPGRLGDIVVEGGDPAPVRGAFEPLLGEPLTLDAVTSRLQALNALPGIAAQASFGPGSEVGESRLRLDLLEQRRWLAAATLDNHGDDATGEQRFGATVSWLNPRDAGDRLLAGILQTLNPANQSHGFLDYDTPWGRNRLSARLGSNDFSVGASPGAPRLDGDGTFLDLALRRSLAHGRTRGLTLVLEAARQSLDWDGGVEQSVSLAGVGLAGHRVLDRPRIAADAALSLSVGHVGGDRFIGQDRGFELLELDSEAWMPVSLPLLDGEQKLVARLAGQWSDTLLPATRRLALGGAGGARAFERSLFLADRGLRLGLETRIPLGRGELLGFTELAYGDGWAGDGRRWALLSDVGIGWEGRFTRSLSGRLTWALPLSARGTGGLDDDGPRVYWSLRYEP